MIIRAATRADDAAILDIVGRAIRSGTVFTADPAGGDAGVWAYWRPAHAVNFVAEAEGRVLGTSYLRPNNPPGGPADHIANAGYCTHPAAAGQGVAQALLSHSLVEARSRGFSAMQFNFVVASNTRAVATWTKAGFAVVGRLPGAFRHPEHGPTDALVMWKSLRPDEDD